MSFDIFVGLPVDMYEKNISLLSIGKCREFQKRISRPL